ncbi:MAG TPA: hypothetical protein P5572_01565 [Phycisphaerae bacterium]|nr:hypothetical protein [Phycisphaerae bacterium]
MKILVTAATCGCLLANVNCLTKKFAGDIASDAARDVANILLDAFLINPVDDAVNPPSE